MDGSEKKRKKSEIDDGGGRRLKKEATTTTTTTPPPPPPPTEEEVDEFFTILNRMRATVKYFKNNKSSNKVGDTIFPWLEIPAPPEDVTVDVKVTDNNCVLDLNSIPDGGSDQEYLC